MKQYKFDNKSKHQEKFYPEEEDTIDYFAKAMNQKKVEKIFAVIVAVLTVISLIGTYIGVNNLIKLSTTLAYFILGIIAIPLTLILGGLMFLIFNKRIDAMKKDKTITFVSINFLVFVAIGLCMSVFYLIKSATILTYSFSALIICIVLFLVFKAIKNQIRKKQMYTINKEM